MGVMALTVAFLSLAFTIFSFWWLQARTGRIVGYAPSTFTSLIDIDRISLRIPVVAYNTGARSRVVRELQLVLSRLDHQHVLRWNDFRHTLNATDKTEANDFADFASSYVVRGREGDQRFVTFNGDASGDWPPEPEDYHARIQARLDKSDAWVDLDTFTLHLWHVTTDIGTVCSHYNTPEPCSPDEKVRARVAFVQHCTEKWHRPRPTWAENDPL